MAGVSQEQYTERQRRRLIASSLEIIYGNQDAVGDVISEVRVQQSAQTFIQILSSADQVKLIQAHMQIIAREWKRSANEVFKKRGFEDAHNLVVKVADALTAPQLDRNDLEASAKELFEYARQKRGSFGWMPDSQEDFAMRVVREANMVVYAHKKASRSRETRRAADATQQPQAH